MLIDEKIFIKSNPYTKDDTIWIDKILLSTRRTDRVGTRKYRRDTYKRLWYDYNPLFS